MIRLLLGGSPCTFWSIAQKNNRETEASGMGWELFKNYLIAKEKFKPDYFLYENNVSAAQPIKEEIKKQLNVWDGTFLMSYTDVRYIEINSALVSAQNRERFYVNNCGVVGQPKDRGILLRDVLESGIAWKDKMNTIDANYAKGGNFSDMQRQSAKRFGVAEPVRIPEYGCGDKLCPVIAGYSCKGDGEGSLADKCFTDNPNKQKVDYVAEPVGVGYRNRREADGKLYRRFETSNEPKANTITTVQTDSMVAEPFQVGAMPRPNGELSTSAGMRVYSTEGKGRVLIANGGGQGAKTGLYVIPVNVAENGKSHTIKAQYYKNGIANFITNNGFDASAVAEIVTFNIATEFDSAGKPTKAYCYADGKIHTVYEVKDGKITIKGKEYPIKLSDGFYIIRKLTVAECRRLQTVPDWYKMPCSDTQNYKMLGNGWTIEVIKHILSHIPNIASGESIEVLSMYDGMSCGQIALKELGANVVKYYATEIDKYAIQTTQANFPNTIQLGDAFQVRNENWNIGD